MIFHFIKIFKIVFQAYNISATTVSQCDRYCYEIDQEVCGETASGTRETFINDCYFYRKQCQEPSNGLYNV